jgi:hypothetical protein
MFSVLENWRVRIRKIHGTGTVTAEQALRTRLGAVL